MIFFLLDITSSDGSRKRQDVNSQRKSNSIKKLQFRRMKKIKTFKTHKIIIIFLKYYFYTLIIYITGGSN
jgi:hypothetical protein